MTDDTELRNLIDDVNEIEKVAAEMKAARAENREPSAEVWPSSIAGNATARPPTELEKWLDEQENWLDDHDRGPGALV